MTYSKKPDTLNTIIERNIEQKKSDWYETPLYILSGAVIVELIRGVFK